MFNSSEFWKGFIAGVGVLAFYNVINQSKKIKEREQEIEELNSANSFRACNARIAESSNTVVPFHYSKYLKHGQPKKVNAH